MKTQMNRRDFVKTAAGGLAASTLLGSETPEAKTPKAGQKIIGIQIGSISFIDEGVEQVLDILQQRARANALWLAAFTYGRGLGGRQVPGHPLPDHGKLEYDLDFHGGNFATVHPEYYKDTAIDPRHTRAPDHGDWDFLAVVPQAAKRRGMKVVCWIEDVYRDDIPNIRKLQEIDLHGRPARTLCHNNPYHRNFLLGLAEDYVRSYDIDGIMYGSERQGALSNALGSRHGGINQDPGRVTCFCSYCEAKAKRLGIDFAQVKAAFEELERFVRAGRARQRPVDGYYVTFWRLVLKYPELLIWENFWHDSLRETYKAIHDKIKSIKANVWFGLHIWHNNSFSPIYRAEQDLSELTKYTDFLKMVMYHNCGGPRIASYIDSVGQTIYGDLPEDELLKFHYRVLNYDEAPYDKVRRAGLKNDYVFREAKRAMDATRGSKTMILPGIDIDIPTDVTESRSTPEDVKAAIKQAFQAGVHGIILSRKYSEMRLTNLSAVGEAIKELGLA